VADGTVHVAGLVLAVIGAIAMVVTAFSVVTLPHALAASLYAPDADRHAPDVGALQYVAGGTTRKWRLRKFDHAAIYLLIAGTYTPFAMQMGPTGRWLLAWMWGVAAVGMILKLTYTGRFDRVAVLLYLGLAWSGVFLFELMVESLPAVVVQLIVAGGLAYTIGVVFHLWRSLRFQNAIWHGFVLCGAVIHYCAVMTSILI
jgi:hemolysin III